MRHSFLLPFLSCFCIFLLMPQPSQAETVKMKIALLGINGEKAGKYASIKDSLLVVLSGRLAAQQQISVIPTQISEEQKQQILTQYWKGNTDSFDRIGADFLGDAFLTSTGEQLRIRLDLYDQKTSAPLSVDAVAEDESKIISAIDGLAQKIVMKIEGTGTETGTAAGIAPENAGIEAFQTEHPEKKYKKQLIAEGASLQESGDQRFIVSNVSSRKTSLKVPLTSFTVGDANGDDVPEVFALSENNIFIYTSELGVFRKKGSIELKPHLNPHSIAAVDIDEDGADELYVSATVNNEFASVIYEKSRQGKYEQIIGNIPYGLRPVHLGSGKVVVYGQKMGNGEGSLLDENVYELIIDKKLGTVKRESKVALPDGVNIFSFVYANLDGDKLDDIVSISSDLKMLVYTRTGGLEWRSSEDYGGSITYLGSRWREDTQESPINNRGDESFVELQYIPARMAALDIDGDGKDEVLAISNELSSYRYLSNMRSFKSGHVSCLQWNGEKMVPLWTTSKFDGHIIDLNLLTISSNENENLSQMNLVLGRSKPSEFGEILKLSADKGDLIMYDLSFSDKNMKDSSKKE